MDGQRQLAQCSTDKMGSSVFATGHIKTDITAAAVHPDVAGGADEDPGTSRGR